MFPQVKIAYCGKHFGEEPPLCGNKDQGSGAIFFSGCNLHCVFCQNFQISQEGLGKFFTIPELARMMLDLQKQNCVCLDLVTPTIWWEQIVEALKIAKAQGLTIPVVWNSNGYELVESLRKLKGWVDIYLPDFKYADDQLAWRYSKAKNYLATAQAAIKEMLAQVGNLQIDEQGIARRGLLVRHLILPNHVENSCNVLRALAQIDKNIYISLMSQYLPLRVEAWPEINRRLAPEEFAKVFDCQMRLGLNNGFAQKFDAADSFVPDFSKKEPFQE